MKFLELEESYNSGWRAKLLVNNNGRGEVRIVKDDFALADQFGWEYRPDSLDLGGIMGEGMVTIGPGEGAELALLVKETSPISRPVQIAYLPGDIKLNISDWS